MAITARYHIWSAAWQGTGAVRLEKLSKIWTGLSITALIACRKEEWRKEVADIPPSKVQNDLCSTRQILALFRGQPCGDCWVAGQSVYGPFQVLRRHIELKLKLKLSQGLCMSPPERGDCLCMALKGGGVGLLLVEPVLPLGLFAHGHGPGICPHTLSSIMAHTSY